MAYVKVNMLLLGRPRRKGSYETNISSTEVHNKSRRAQGTRYFVGDFAMACSSRLRHTGRVRGCATEIVLPLYCNRLADQGF